MSDYLKLSTLKRFVNLLKVDKQEIKSIYIYALFNGVVSLSLPLGIQAIINLLGSGQVSTSWIILVVLVIGGIALSGAMQLMQLRVSENLQQKIFTRSAFEFAYRIPRMKMEAVNQTYMPELVNRFFDTLSIQKGLSKILLDFSSASLQVIFGLLLLSLYHPVFILFSIFLVIIVYFIFRFTAPRGLKTSLSESKYKYEVAHWLEEMARTMSTFKLAGDTPLPLKKTDDAVEGYLNSRNAHFKTLLIQYINLVGFKVIVAAGLLILGGLLVINQQMNIGQFVAAEIIIILVLASIEKVILSMETIYDVLTAIEKIGSVTDIPLDSEEGDKISIEENTNLAVNLSQLSYKFKDDLNPTLTNIDLSINAGEKICISGFNGSGKSILIQVIAGLYTEYSGSLSYSGIPHKNWKQEELHSYIGDNLSKEDIFKGTLLENISLSKPNNTFKQVQEVVEIVGLNDFIEKLPMGYQTELIPEGKNLPKNVRLKLMLARGLMGQAKLLLLEDNFNQLNNEGKTRLLKHIIDQNYTVIAISNDPEIAIQFDKVAVLEKGQIIAFDKLEKMKKQAWYSQIFQKN